MHRGTQIANRWADPQCKASNRCVEPKAASVSPIIVPLNVLFTASVLLPASPERCGDFRCEIQCPAAEGEPGVAAGSAERSAPEAVRRIRLPEAP